MKGEVVAGRKHKLWIWEGISAMAIVALATFEILLARAAPILRARLLQSLSARYRSRVELVLLTSPSCAALRCPGKTWRSIPTTSNPTHRRSRCSDSPSAPAMPVFSTPLCISATSRSKGCVSISHPKASAKTWLHPRPGILSQAIGLRFIRASHRFCNNYRPWLASTSS